ncbi:hypothetical protein HMN09_00362000 [Mycena chlorophos]|uniref:Uncharacterized protein n=1 Tax=Mycena chlorophos TaxID=658473 RepID=A0A8H6TKU3_MYCCL|nr:hypothetical protein HMN09_00362000 [Mycena chlorophos]
MGKPTYSTVPAAGDTSADSDGGAPTPVGEDSLVPVPPCGAARAIRADIFQATTGWSDVFIAEFTARSCVGLLFQNTSDALQDFVGALAKKHLEPDLSFMSQVDEKRELIFKKTTDKYPVVNTFKDRWPIMSVAIKLCKNKAETQKRANERLAQHVVQQSLVKLRSASLAPLRCLGVLDSELLESELSESNELASRWELAPISSGRMRRLKMPAAARQTRGLVLGFEVVPYTGTTLRIRPNTAPSEPKYGPAMAEDAAVMMDALEIEALDADVRIGLAAAADELWTRMSVITPSLNAYRPQQPPLSRLLESTPQMNCPYCSQVPWCPNCATECASECPGCDAPDCRSPNKPEYPTTYTFPGAHYPGDGTMKAKNAPRVPPSILITLFVLQVYYERPYAPPAAIRGHPYVRVPNTSLQSKRTAREAREQAPLLSVDELGNLLTGLVIADENDDPQSEEYSRLFSSREEVQDEAPDVPMSFAPVQSSEALPGLASMLSEALNEPGPPADTALPDLQPLECFPRSIGLGSFARRDREYSYEALDTATAAVVDAGRLLSSVKVPTEEPAVRARRSRTRYNAALSALYERVEAEARLVDAQIDVVGALLPKVEPTNEVEYDSEHHFVNGMALYDTVAQALTLLAVICHITIGINQDSCDFILSFVITIIRATMGIGTPSLRPNPKQEDVLKQLPPNLDAALRRFKLDPKTVIYAREVGIAFFHPWVDYDIATCHPDYRLPNPVKEIPQIRRIQSQLTVPVLPRGEADQPMPPSDSRAPIAITSEKLADNLKGSNVPALRFVAHSLGLDLTGVPASERFKKPYIDRLVAWRYLKPLSDNNYVPRAIDMSALKFIQRVIADTDTPGWIDSVPYNYGQSGAGTIKAAEWRILATIYVPIALVLLWNDGPVLEKRIVDMLDHSMALFSAVILVGRYTMTAERAALYRDLLKTWVDGLPVVHPHTRNHPVRPNIHVAFHIYDFLIAFGPIISWWCFPFERVIGFLQKMNTNNHIGGELETTLTRSFFRGAALRRWLRRPDCPRVIQELKALFDKTFPSYNPPRDSAPRST